MKENEKTKERDKAAFSCPVASLVSDLQNRLGAKSPFFKHLNQSRIEFLKAIRSLIDDRIASLEERASGKTQKKRVRIKVE